MRRTTPAALGAALILLTGGCAAQNSEIPREVPNPSPTASAPATGGTPPPPAPHPDDRAGRTYRVDRVVDGDTVRIIRDGESVALRLIGGDTPETVHPSVPTECYGPEASAEAKRLLTGKTVTVVYDPTQGRATDEGYRVDKYGRDLVYLQLPDGRDFMEHMISEGFASEYTYRGDAYQRQGEYRAAEDAAQAADAGLWGAC